MSTTDDLTPVKPEQVERQYVEHPDWPTGTRLRCTSCHGTLLLYPQRTVDPRWATGWCSGCKKRRIADVELPPSR